MHATFRFRLYAERRPMSVPTPTLKYHFWCQVYGLCLIRSDYRLYLSFRQAFVCLQQLFILADVFVDVFFIRDTHLAENIRPSFLEFSVYVITAKFGKPRLIFSFDYLSLEPLVFVFTVLIRVT